MTLWWFSRHDPLPAQRRALNELFPNVPILVHKRLFVDAEEIAGRVQPDDEVVIVAPLSLIAKLLDLGLQPLWPMMEPTTEDYAKAHLDECVSAPRDRWQKFLCFRRLVRIELRFEEVTSAAGILQGIIGGKRQ